MESIWQSITYCSVSWAEIILTTGSRSFQRGVVSLSTSKGCKFMFCLTLRIIKLSRTKTWTACLWFDSGWVAEFLSNLQLTVYDFAALCQIYLIYIWPNFSAICLQKFTPIRNQFINPLNSEWWKLLPENIEPNQFENYKCLHSYTSYYKPLSLMVLGYL